MRSMLILLSFWGGMGHLHAEEAKVEAQPVAGISRPLVFLAQVDYAPWVLKNAQGSVQGGILYEMAHTIGKLAGFTVDVQSIPHARFEQLVHQQKFDFTFVTKQQAPTRGKLFPEPIMESQLGLLYLAKNAPFADCSRMKSVAHTIQSSNLLSAHIAKTCGPLKIVHTNSLEQRMKMLKHGRIDSYLGSDRDRDLAAWFGLDCGSLAFVKFFDTSFHVLLSENSPLAQPTHHAGISHFIQTYRTEHYERIRRKVLGDRFCPVPNEKAP